MRVLVLAIAIAAGVWLLTKKSASSASQLPSIANDGEPPEEGSPVTFDEKVQRFAQAIAKAEGFGKPGAVPTLSHNPGDLGPGDTGYQGRFTAGSVVSQLPDDETGWQKLRDKLRRIFSGKSTTYSPNMTITEMAQKYAGDWQNWSNNVSADLGVSPDTRISDWLESEQMS
jgi:hypothetical protein